MSPVQAPFKKRDAFQDSKQEDIHRNVVIVDDEPVSVLNDL